MKKSAIGGSALIEGLMMIGPSNAAIALRKSDGGILLEKKVLPKKSTLTKIFILRGIISFVTQMLLSMRALMFSAEQADIEPDTEASAFERFLERLFKDKLMDVLIAFSLVFSLAFSIGLFILLPNIIAGFFHFDKTSSSGLFYYNAIEGCLRIGLFLGYLAFASAVKDVRRVWQYHGAEHKTINCYEHGDDLTVDNVMRHSTRHSRCSTSYMFLVLVVSILLFSMTGWYSIWINILIRLLLMPLVAGITYEIFRYAGTRDSGLAKAVAFPGLVFQALTTKEPDRDQVEVAISAFNSVLAEEMV